MLYPGRPEFEANADRARESADTLLATSLTEQAERERRSDARAAHPGRGRSMAVVDRVLAAVGALLGR